MNVACIPYHDWRKITMEGARTRDSHIMNHLMDRSDIENLIIVNRPISFLELYVKKKNQPIEGKMIYKYKNVKLYELKTNVYLIDCISNDLIGPLYKKKRWFFDAFASLNFKDAYDRCVKFLKLNVDVVFSQNIFAAGFIKHYKSSVFDAWDNFILFPENEYIRSDLKDAYLTYADKSAVWITNSLKNMDYYRKHYSPQNCALIKNGVDIESFRKQYQKPDDLLSIRSPIIGFGGKITHLFNVDYFNYAVKQHPDKSFVIVGQILDKEVFNNISKASNVFYLGDKHYSVYKSYVTNFDIGIIPYVSDHLEHGADSIKMYEYLAAGLSVVGTPGAGMADMSSYIHIAESKEEFSEYINTALTSVGAVELPDEYTWRYKTGEIVKMFGKLTEEK